ncbi:MAG: DUF3299 domain-containing protein [Burkholderiales bacterium]|nr:DUF3299 domain-containing protein [Burkholderiales bacterium]
MKSLILCLALFLGVHTVAWAFKGLGGKDIPSGDAARGAAAGVDAPLPASPYMGKPLPELKGVVSWRTLAQVESVRVKDRFVPQFSSNVTALDKKEIRLQGFMMPLDMSDRQKRFLLVALPPTCAFCLPGGPEQIVEVQAKTPIKYGFEPIVLSGRLAVLRDDPMGLFYRLTGAVAVTR